MSSLRWLEPRAGGFPSRRAGHQGGGGEGALLVVPEQVLGREDSLAASGGVLAGQGPAPAALLVFLHLVEEHGILTSFEGAGQGHHGHQTVQGRVW